VKKDPLPESRGKWYYKIPDVEGWSFDGHCITIHGLYCANSGRGFKTLSFPWELGGEEASLRSTPGDQLESS